MAGASPITQGGSSDDRRGQAKALLSAIRGILVELGGVSQLELSCTFELDFVLSRRINGHLGVQTKEDRVVGSSRGPVDRWRLWLQLRNALTGLGG